MVASCHSQIASTMSTKPVTTAITTSTPVCLPATHSNQRAVRYMGNAKNCFRFSIHCPGLGSFDASDGINVSATKGSAIPSPKKAKINSATLLFCEIAKPSAGPMKGAVQGLATVVASTPVINDEARSLLVLVLCPTDISPVKICI